ncbi:hypothetical protein [Nostoc foliaceum]|nr:hypothetical protein [Nostoc foliaceum]
MNIQIISLIISDMLRAATPQILATLGKLVTTLLSYSLGVLNLE